MSRRDNPDRCPVCRMHATLCICALVPHLATRTRLALLVHHREAQKPTNTGQLAARCLVSSTLTVVGARGSSPALPPIGPAEQAVVLFPGDDAVPITRYADLDTPIVLIVPDGTWRQASKQRRHFPGLAGVPCVSLPEASAAAYRLRTEHRAEGLATVVAIARALRILEGEAGPAIEAAMLAVFRTMVERTLWLRGALPDAGLSDGVPAAARARDPRGGTARRP